MAIYDNLPVFKQAYDLLLQILRFTSSVQRDFRYTVGETLKKDVIELCLCIYRANASVEKLPQIEAARERMVSIKLMVRVLHDMKQISTKPVRADLRADGVCLQTAGGMAEVHG